jgi:ADP-ribosylglycohydrolase
VSRLCQAVNPRDYLERKFGYSLDASIDELRPSFTFQVSCKATVPPAIIAFLESTDYEHAIRLAVSLGGDSDTIACIAEGIAQAFYGGVPPKSATSRWRGLTIA